MHSPQHSPQGQPQQPSLPKPTDARPELRRELGLGGAVSMGVGGTIGGGIFVLVGVMSGLAGPGALAAFALAFVVSLLVALPYAELACRSPVAGGSYAFTRLVLGPNWGYLMGWGFLGAWIFSSGYVTLGFGGYLHALTGLSPVAGAALLVVACLLLNLRGVKAAGAAQTVILVVAVAGLVGFMVLGLPHVHLNYLTPLAPHGVGGILSAALLAAVALGGFDVVATAGEEIQRPERNLPLGILFTLLISFGLYALVTFVALGVLPWQQLAASPAPLARAAEMVFGPGGKLFVTLVALLTTAATGNAMLVVSSRILFAMSRDGALPTTLSRVSKDGAPWLALLLCAAGLVAVALPGQVGWVAAIGGFLYVSHYILPLVSLVILRRSSAERPAFVTPLPQVVLPLAFVGVTTLLVSSGHIGLLGGVGWLALGLLLRWVLATVNKN